MFVKSFGLFWRRDEVIWHPGRGKRSAFQLLGHQGYNFPRLRMANFRFQQGIYILYGDHGAYYVGLTKKQGLGKRLKDHTTDQHSDYWDRFSWFGFRAVLNSTDEAGICKLKDLPNVSLGKPPEVITDVEALLIRAMGLSNIRKMNFAEADEWAQVKSYEAERYLRRVA